jgi:hypothetical protein
MKLHSCSRTPLLLAAGLLLLASLVVSPASAQTTPVMAIEQTDGFTVRHPVTNIQAVYFDTDALIVALEPSEVFTYPLETIRRVLFEWPDVSGAVDPHQAAAMTKVLRLFQNQPNPACLATSIDYELQRPGPVHLAIFSVSGAKIRTLVEGERPAGRHTVAWDGRDDGGEQVAAGVYFCRLRSAGANEIRRMVILQ